MHAFDPEMKELSDCCIFEIIQTIFLREIIQTEEDILQCYQEITAETIVGLQKKSNN